MSGKLFYLIGASGAGKDSLLRLCQDRLQHSPAMVAHRYITRPPEAGNENHIWLPEGEFDKRRELDLFAMHWRANGYQYGIGCEIDVWLARGSHVLVNGSRAYLDRARQRYGSQLVPVLVRVDQAHLRRRLLERGRETAEEVEQRVARSERFAATVPAGTALVDNNGELEQAFDQLLELLAQQPVSQREAVARES